MANPNPNPATRFKPGVSPNPGGRPIGARNRIQGDFLNALADDLERHGRKVIEKAREEDPLGYLRVIASLMPKELETRKTPFDDISDEELEASIITMRAIIDAQANGNDKGPPTGVNC